MLLLTIGVKRICHRARQIRPPRKLRARRNPHAKLKRWPSTWCVSIYCVVKWSPPSRWEEPSQTHPRRAFLRRMRPLPGPRNRWYFSAREGTRESLRSTDRCVALFGRAVAQFGKKFWRRRKLIWLRTTTTMLYGWRTVRRKTKGEEGWRLGGGEKGERQGESGTVRPSITKTGKRGVGPDAAGAFLSIICRPGAR